MTSYRERHHKLTGTVACEVWTEDKRVFIVRLQVSPNERKSYISTNLINEANGEWLHQLDGTINIRLRPGRWDLRNKSAPTFPINFTPEQPSYFTKVTKRELPTLISMELETQFQYFTSFGFTYTFGSIYNNVVNPRFGNSGGGGMSISFN